MSVALTPLAAVFGGLSPTFEALGWAVVAGLALSTYLGVLRPWVKTVVITTLLVESRDLSPDSETMDYIAGRSSKFKELVANAETEPRHPADGRRTRPTETLPRRASRADRPGTDERIRWSPPEGAT